MGLSKAYLHMVELRNLRFKSVKNVIQNRQAEQNAKQNR